MAAAEVLVLLLVLLAPRALEARLLMEDRLVNCDPNSPEGEWSPECDSLGSEAIFAMDGNETARFERAVEVLPGLRLPHLGACPEEHPLSRMVDRVMRIYFSGCIAILRYDRFLESSCGVQRMLSGALSQGLTHGRLAGTGGGTSGNQSPVPRDGPCATSVYLLQHVEDARSINRAGTSHSTPVLLVTASPLWRVEEFLLRWELRPLRMVIIASAHRAQPVISTQHLTKQWFPRHVTVAIRNEPPFVIHRPNDTSGQEWSGVEVTLLQILSEKLNFTFSQRVIPEREGLEVVRDSVTEGAADIGAGGIYMSADLERSAASVPFTMDCAVFLTRASTALPRHRAILGPFQLSVWLTLTAAYLILMMAVAAPRKNKMQTATGQSRLDSFWLVFGTFTNAFIMKTRTFSDRASVRILLCFYWVFTVIITAAYTSSIIAFVTLPVFPATIDTAEEIISSNGFKWGTLASWDKWLRDSDDGVSRHVQAGFEWLPRVDYGIVNVSRSARYAFLGSRERLQYESNDDLSGVLSGKKVLHLGSQCFLPLLPALVAAPALRPALDPITLTLIQTGVLLKATRDIEWQEQRRRIRGSTVGVIRMEYTRRMPHERRLSIEDVVGTFILLGIGYGSGLFAFGIEKLLKWMRLTDFAGRLNSAMENVKRRVSRRSRSGSNSSASSSRQSLRLRSGRLWSRTSRGSRLGSLLDVVPERGGAKPASLGSSASASRGGSGAPSTMGTPSNHGSTAWAASAPSLAALAGEGGDVEMVQEIDNLSADGVITLRRPQSSN